MLLLNKSSCELPSVGMSYATSRTHATLFYSIDLVELITFVYGKLIFRSQCSLNTSPQSDLISPGVKYILQNSFIKKEVLTGKLHRVIQVVHGITPGSTSHMDSNMNVAPWS